MEVNAFRVRFYTKNKHMSTLGFLLLLPPGLRRHVVYFAGHRGKVMPAHLQNRENTNIPAWFTQELPTAFTVHLARRIATYDNPDLFLDLVAESNELAEHYLEVIMASDWLHGALQERFIRRGLVMLMLMLCQNSQRGFLEDSAQIMQVSDPLEKEVVHSFVLGYRKEIRAMMGDVDFDREKLLGGICGFCANVLERVQGENLRVLDMIVRQPDPPAFVPPYLQKRLALAMHLPNRDQVRQILLQKYPLLVRGSHKSGWLHPGRPILHRHWLLLLDALPTTEEAMKRTQYSGSLRDFHCILWEANQSDRAVRALRDLLKKKGRSTRLPQISGFKGSDNKHRNKLLAQMFTVLLPNWQAMWVQMGWRRNNEIQRRLRFLQDCHWHADAKDVVRILFGR